MQKRPRLDASKCLWIRSGIMDQSSIFRSLRKALVERNATILTLNGPQDTDGLERIRKAVWASDAHVLMDGMMPGELGKLHAVFKDRKNFSLALVDWWTSVYWFTKNADYLIFRNYNGIAVRRGLAPFAGGRRPPLIFWPDQMIPYIWYSSALRILALALAPALQLRKARLRQLESIAPERLLYFPFTIAGEHVPLKQEKPEYDFCNVSATGGFWLMRDPRVSAWLNFGNLYHDRLRITKLIQRCDGGSYKFFDLRRSGYLNWEEYMRVVQGSRFAIATGGLHQNSVAKYAEFACLGTPMLGEEIPFEYPWLKDCLFSVDTLNVTGSKLQSQLREALSQQARLRENCLNVREILLKLYHPHRVLDLLQEQADGKPIPPGYLKPEAAGLDRGV